MPGLPNAIQSWKDADDRNRTHPPPGPGLRTGGPQLAEHRWQVPGPRIPARQDRAAGLLDVLLHQLPARPGRTPPARAAVLGRPRDGRRAFAQVRARGRSRGAGGRRRTLRDPPPGPRRPRAGHLEGLHGPGLADPGGHRSRGLHRGAPLRRGPRRRPRRPDPRTHRRTRGQGHPAPRRRPLRGAGTDVGHAALPGQGPVPARRPRRRNRRAAVRGW